MGYMRHHAIIVTGWNRELVLTVREHAVDIFSGHCSVSPIISSHMNGYESFFIAPDGSKEGWTDSNCADTARDVFVAYLNSQRYPDNSSSLSWVCVQYGDDEGLTAIVADSDEYKRARHP